MRSIIVVVTALTLSSGCENARQQQEKANKAQAEADQKIAEANREATEKSNQAQADANKQVADAQAAFSKLREDYRHDVNTKLADVDKKIADLEAKAKTEKAAKKATLEAKIADIKSSRDAFVNEYRGIETASASTWDDVRKRLDKSWSELQLKIDRA